mgnify:CR=1 FL=1|jgi:hypothetical protein
MLVPGERIELSRCYQRGILRVPEREFHRKILIGYKTIFRGVERGAKRIFNIFLNDKYLILVRCKT